jgi:hypothetical protein
MGDVPEDVRAAAYVALGKVDGDGAVGVIVNAILAERQRCADLADKEAAGYKENGFPQAALGCITTRKAILN